MLKIINLKKLTNKTLVGILLAGSLIIQLGIEKAAANPPNEDSNSDSSPTTITLTGTIRDFQASHPDFESTTGNDRGLVTTELGADKKPVYAHGENGTRTTNGETNFNQWYRDVSGINQSKEHSIDLTLQSDGTYRYQNNQFFPINGELWGNYRDNKNYHFTYELHTKFTYNGGEVFTFSGDDDVFVFINGEIVIDIGGVHTSQTQSTSLDSLGLTVGETYDLDFFFAERHYSQSNFTITTSIELETTVNPDDDEDNDGIPNILEGFETEVDSDDDGTPDYLDLDSDNDTIPDADEGWEDFDADDTPNFQDLDSDGDGIPDSVETGEDSPLDDDSDPNFLDTDSDGDGIPDENENYADSNDEDTESDITDSDLTDGETQQDVDGDGNDNYLDDDSDEDGFEDYIDPQPYIENFPD